ncbi:MAG: TraR/DksA C4-type zinc finger protein [Candidatus Sungbacteria bacterium]|nr:TraR/DksA C4-type zinc finger protein [Candidatus Sungbacteria bacterium]
MGEAQNASSSTMEENADEVEEYETRLEETEILERHLADVVRALDKMQKGTYGLCEACGKEIPVGRLHANPAARFDIEHEG